MRREGSLCFSVTGVGACLAADRGLAILGGLAPPCITSIAALKGCSPCGRQLSDIEIALPQVESTAGTPLANVADVSVEIKADPASSADVMLAQMSTLLHDYTAMSVSPLPRSGRPT